MAERTLAIIKPDAVAKHGVNVDTILQNVVHGVAEHAGRYDRTGRLLADAGIAVTGYDLMILQAVGGGNAITTRGEGGRVGSAAAAELPTGCGDLRSG